IRTGVRRDPGCGASRRSSRGARRLVPEPRRAVLAHLRSRLLSGPVGAPSRATWPAHLVGGWWLGRWWLGWGLGRRWWRLRRVRGGGWLLRRRRGGVVLVLPRLCPCPGGVGETVLITVPLPATA